MIMDQKSPGKHKNQAHGAILSGITEREVVQ